MMLATALHGLPLLRAVPAAPRRPGCLNLGSSRASMAGRGRRRLLGAPCGAAAPPYTVPAGHKQAGQPLAAGLARAAIVTPTVEWAVRMCAYYVLLRVGITGKRPAAASAGAPAVAAGDDDSTPLSGLLPEWLKDFLGGESEAKKARQAMRLTSKWKTSTKGTLVRKLRVPSKSEGRRMLQHICGVLSDDELFFDAGVQKTCQIRRESAHGESVCSSNVRALFDELPTPHLELEITVFPPGPITSVEYERAAKLETALKTGRTI